MKEVTLADDSFTPFNHVASSKSYKTYFYFEHPLQYDFQYGLLQSTKFDFIYQFLSNFARVQFCSNYIKTWCRRLYQWRKTIIEPKLPEKFHYAQISG